MSVILKGLIRGLDPDAIETGVGHQDDVLINYYPSTTPLGAVLPSNSPDVNSLWLPALALRIPVILNPGREDPWTPWRIINALIEAGCPAEAFGFYPANHDGAAVIQSFRAYCAIAERFLEIIYDGGDLDLYAMRGRCGGCAGGVRGCM